MRIDKRFCCLLIAGICLICGCIFCLGAVRTNDKTVIPKNVYIEGINVGKMTTEQALEACGAVIDKLSDTKIVFFCGFAHQEYRLSDIGYTTNLEEKISYSLKYGRTGNVLKRLK